MSILLAFVLGCSPVDPPSDWNGEPAARHVSDPLEVKVQHLVDGMTLEEKVGQILLVSNLKLEEGDIAAYHLGGVMSGGSGSPAPNAPEQWVDMIGDFQDEALGTPPGIPIWYAADTVHGVGGVLGATVFPHNVGLGAAGDAVLVQQIARATAQEARAVGITWALAPAVSIPQDLRWGRVYESFSQDPDTVGLLGAAAVEGLHGPRPSAPDAMLATVKHFVADGAVAWGTSTLYPIDQGDAPIDDAALYDVHLVPYVAAVKAGAQAVMVSQSSVNGERMHGNQTLIEGVLRGTLAFDGVVVSDWNGMSNLPGDLQEQVTGTVSAGVDVLMLAKDWRLTYEAVVDAVVAGDIPEERLDEAVGRVIAVKMEMGLFRHPYPEVHPASVLRSPEHVALAEKAVQRSLVLLHHDGDTLPLDRDPTLVVVSGDASNNTGLQCGGWTVTWQGQLASVVPGTTILDGIRDVVEPEGIVLWSPSGTFSNVADGQADIGIAVVGERPYAEGHGDRADLALDPGDVMAVQRVAQKSQRTVVVLVTGRPRLIDAILPYADAVVVAWLPGSEGAPVGRMLFGEREFTGRLPLDWPRDMSQVPAEALAADDCPPLFSRGHGLDVLSSSAFPVPCP